MLGLGRRIAKLRSSLFRVFRAIATGNELPDDDLDLVSEALVAAMPAIRLVRGEDGVTVGWAGDEDALDRMIWPVLFSTMELLTSLEGQPHVRQCAAPGCNLFFVDRTPTHRRRWCERRTCGSRTKSLRYYHKTGKHNRGRDWLHPE